MKTSPKKSALQFWQNNLQRLAAKFVVLATFVGLAPACDVCLRLPGIPFEFDHPAAMEVAMATQEAAEHGQLELNPLLKQTFVTNRHLPPRLETISPQQLVTFWSQTRPARNYPSLRFTLELIFVDVERTCPLEVRFGNVFDSDPRNGPASIRIFTTKAGFYRLIEDGLESCEQRKLVAVESDGDENREGIQQLFTISTKIKSSNAVTSL